MNPVMNITPRTSLRTLFAFLALLTATTAAHAQVILTGNGSYTQTFSQSEISSSITIATATTYTWTDNTSIVGWYSILPGTANTQVITTNMGAQLGNGLYLARQGGTSAALAIRRSDTSTAFAAFGVRFLNNTGKEITALDISYLAQQWQKNSGNDTLDFQYAIGATSLNDELVTWIDHNALDVPTFTLAANETTKNQTTTPDHTTPAYSGTRSSSITGLSIADGQTFWLRWVDRNIDGVEQALSVDNFNLTVTFASPPPTVPEPAAYALVIALLSLAGCALHRSRRIRQN
ncbi:hypothetical protein [Geminisphaera colitermitum]|uniref:hypothetical protein n=1 Tax=Geminisphaera colitermitum TaxID=1148786 RepID=UPI000158CC0B|nr:hypothetical protein [Geminisphaera colitermitum]